MKERMSNGHKKKDKEAFNKRGLEQNCERVSVRVRRVGEWQGAEKPG